MRHLASFSASGAREQRRLPQEAPESDTWGAREQVGATWGAREWQVEEGRRYFVHLGRQRAGWGHLGRQRVTKLRRGGGILSTWAAREQVGATWDSRERWR